MAAGDLITTDHQVEWRGTVWGGYPDTDWAVTDLQGWYGYTLRGSNAERPGRHGSYPGLKRANERVIEVELTGMVDTADLALLRAATALDEDPVEEELVIRAGTTEAQYVLARLERLAIPTDHDWSVGHHRATLQWVATDPRRYSVAEYTSPTIGLPVGAGGSLAFPLAFPLGFGSGSGASQVTVTNSGDTATWPVFVITGPVTGPIVTNADTGQRLQFVAGFEVEAGQTMTIDTDARAVTVNGVGRSGDLAVREWFPLPVGATTLTFAGQGAYDPAASFYVTYRHAYS